jgi:protein-S-isoprenylcysteine O-methyltransferase Ste14
LIEIFIGQLPLFLVWAAYLSLHSLLAAHACRRWLIHWLPALGERYRAAYNVLALLALIPIFILARQNPGSVLWVWQGAAAIVADTLAVLALVALPWASRGYDLKSFAGFPGDAGAPKFVIAPAHRYVRHPWYALGLLVLWTRDMNAAMFASAFAITLYLPIGIVLEERKLIAAFGRRYLQYRQRVSPLLPLPWRTLTAAEARELTADDRPLEPASH